MSGAYDILAGGQSAADFDSALAELEVEENADMPGAFSLTLPITLTATGDLDVASDPRLAPMSNIAVVAKAADGKTHCLIDGFVLSHTAHLDAGVAGSTLKVWGLDATWLMNTEEKTREWVDMTDGAVANTIFGEHGVDPADVNLEDDSPSHTEDTHSSCECWLAAAASCSACTAPIPRANAPAGSASRSSMAIPSPC